MKARGKYENIWEYENMRQKEKTKLWKKTKQDQEVKTQTVHAGAKPDPDLTSFLFSNTSENVCSVLGYSDEEACVCVCVCVLRQGSIRLTPVVLWSVALGSSGDAQVLHIKYSFHRNSWALNNSQRSMPEVCPCYPRHVSVWTMASREHQDGERKVEVGGGRERKTDSKWELDLVYR